jgi:hypothetical protein
MAGPITSGSEIRIVVKEFDGEGAKKHRSFNKNLNQRKLIMIKNLKYSTNIHEVIKKTPSKYKFKLVFSYKFLLTLQKKFC